MTDYKTNSKSESGELPGAGPAGLCLLSTRLRLGQSFLSVEMTLGPGQWAVVTGRGEVTAGTSKSLKPTGAGALPVFNMYSHCNSHLSSYK